MKLLYLLEFIICPIGKYLLFPSLVYNNEAKYILWPVMFFSVYRTKTLF